MSNQQRLIFESVFRSNKDNTSVWKYFKRSTDNKYVECQICYKQLKHSSATTPMRNHLKLIHTIDLKTLKENQTRTNRLTSNTEINTTTIKEPQAKKSKIDDYFKTDETVETYISKMAALDGFPFRVFCSSETLRKLFHGKNFELPKSPNTVRNIVMAKCVQLKEELKKDIILLKSTGCKFSVTLDEWTSTTKNKRYMNVNIHSPQLKVKPFRNLGLSRIIGSGTTQNCTNILEKKLMEFDLSLDEDIICLTTDGASVMRALGERAKAQSQLCIAHGIQCAVIDVLYKQTSEDTNTRPSTSHNSVYESEDTDSDDSESETTDDGFEIINEATLNIPMFVYKDLIQKVRKVVKYFKKSPTKMEQLNAHLTGNDKNLQLILDCKTRWSSLADMITRFLRIKEGVMKALIDLKETTTFANSEIDTLEDLSSSLNIIKATVQALCAEDANLLVADTALKFMTTKLAEKETAISKQLLQALNNRISQRRDPVLFSTINYLHNPTKFYSETSIYPFKKASNNEVLNYILKILKSYTHHLNTRITITNSNDDSDHDDEVPLIIYRQQKPENYTEELTKQIESTINNTQSTSALPTETDELETIVRVQMALFDSGGPRNEYLNKVYEHLCTIPPTSVESERVFSSSGYICNKLRTSLNDTSIDGLIFLRSHYQRGVKELGSSSSSVPVGNSKENLTPMNIG